MLPVIGVKIEEPVGVSVSVLHGLADARVPPGQGFEFYAGLKALGVEADMVVYPREPHVFVERAHWVDRLRRTLDWFDRHLKK